MNQTNSIIVDGNLVKDALFSEPKAGFKVCKMSMAVNRWYKDENGTSIDRVSYFDIEAYGNSAEFCNKYAKKGTPMRVVGRLQQDRWTNKEGKADSKVYIVAEHIEVLKRPGIEVEATEKNYPEKAPEATPVAAAVAAAVAATEAEAAVF